MLKRLLDTDHVKYIFFKVMRLFDEGMKYFF